jgi:phosphatidylserine/phosphatidylglycerophosphate/cardiolipin synthase-like enzyme
MRVFLFLILLTPFFLTPSLSFAQFTPSDLKKYFTDLPGNYLISNEIDDSKWSEKRFVLFNQKLSLADPLSKIEIEENFTQDLFSINVTQFNQFENSEDFLDAKSSFYSRLNFNPRTQLHERPYAYLSSWMSLNHPPLKKVQGTPELIYKNFKNQPTSNQPHLFQTIEFQKKIDSISGTELTFENETKPLFNGDSIKEKTALIRRSKHFIFGAVMATICDPSSEDFIQALIEQSKKGVVIKLLMERFYMGAIFRSCANRLRREGIDLQLVSLKWSPETFLSFFHPKFWVSDSEEVIVGGQNIASFENNSTGYNRQNRDTDLWIKGPVATDFAAGFLKLWDRNANQNQKHLNGVRAKILHHLKYQRMYQLRGKHAYSTRLMPHSGPLRGACRAILQLPENQNLSIAEIMKEHVEHSDQSIILTSPEIQFKLPPRMSSSGDHLISSLVSAAQHRGVNIEFISNGVDGGNGEFTETLRKKLSEAKKDHRWVLAKFLNWVLSFQPQYNARKHRRQLLNLAQVPHFRTWTHFNYMHAKQALFDRLATLISSVNLDQASMDRNVEAGALCMDESLSRQMEAQLALDLANSVPVVSANE